MAYQQVPALNFKQLGSSPLESSVQRLSKSLLRLRLFLLKLEPCKWLPWPDVNSLLKHGLSSLVTLKSSLSIDLNRVPEPSPLPCGQNLGEVEAIHLILAHDMYMELRNLIKRVQAIGIREVPVMLLVMMVTFFRTNQYICQQDKVMKIHDYYMHTLQVNKSSLT